MLLTALIIIIIRMIFNSTFINDVERILGRSTDSLKVDLFCKIGVDMCLTLFNFFDKVLSHVIA